VENEFVSPSHRSDCRSCGSTQLTKFLSLGPTPLANRFIKASELALPEPTFPLDLYWCAVCSLVQVCEVVPPEILFRDYIYVSGTSATMPAHFAALANEVAERFLLPGSLVVEPASNDGTLLSAFNGRDVRVLGVEPATNVAAMARKRGINTINEFFSESISEEILSTQGAADAIIATNVFAHVDDLNGFTRAAKRLMSSRGVFVVEASYLFDTLDHLQFDSVYHEHLCFFSLTALAALFDRHELEIFDVQHQTVHGGSLRVYAQHKGGGHAVTNALVDLLRKEERRGVRNNAVYLGFAERVCSLRERLVEMIRGLRSQGLRVVAYGASAKGNTLLNFMNLGPDLVEYVVDKSPLKQGLFTPGMRLPVHSPDRLLIDQPDYALILAWNFVSEILRQQEGYIQAGGKFIVPAPEPHIIP
jgi:SAM-dependent methyltransferase